MDEDEGNEFPEMEWRCDKCYYHYRYALSAVDIFVFKREKYNTELFLYHWPGCPTACLDDNSLKEHFQIVDSYSAQEVRRDQWEEIETVERSDLVICIYAYSCYYYKYAPSAYGKCLYFGPRSPNTRAGNVVLRRGKLL